VEEAVSVLRVEGLTKEFGGVHAVEDVSFAVEPGAVFSVIGPNGAGKTTLFNLITGLYEPTAGKVLFRDDDVTKAPPHRLAERGMARTFQNLQIFFNMTAVENVMVGRTLAAEKGVLATLLALPKIRRSDEAARAKAEELMRFVGLGDYLDAESDAMPYGALKRLEIARALAAEPKLLLLDEPAAGLNPAETAEIGPLIRRIRDAGTTVVLVEHDMKLVMGVSDRILVLNYGQRLAEGTAAEVRANPDVVAAYLGTGHA
jgi:branched-chain amino acid transport system ATP-binding protein